MTEIPVIQKPAHWFAKQINGLISIWWYLRHERVKKFIMKSFCKNESWFLAVKKKKKKISKKYLRFWRNRNCATKGSSILKRESKIELSKYCTSQEQGKKLFCCYISSSIYPEAYSEPWQSFKMKRFAKIANGFKTVDYFHKTIDISFWQGSNCNSDTNYFFFHLNLIRLFPYFQQVLICKFSFIVKVLPLFNDALRNK